VEILVVNAFAWASVGCYVIAGIGCLYALTASWLASRFGRSPIRRGGSFPSVTILKPLHGAEPGLYDHLASFCVQDYAGPRQIVFGVQDPKDAAIAVVHRLIRDFPALDIELVVNSRRHGTNRKVANLINMAPHARHDVVILSDSDIVVEPDYLENITTELDQPGVGLVTCLYRGAGGVGIWADLAASQIDYHFLPGALVGIALDRARPCFGSTIALRKETLALIGGFESLAEQLADDYAMGEMVRRLGLEVAISPVVVTHSCMEKRARDLFWHELRWARTIRFVDGPGFVGSAVTHALPFALMGALLGGLTPAGILVVVGALACRLRLQIQLDRTFGLVDNPVWMGPTRDLLSFVIFVASFFGREVDWRGHRYEVRADNTLIYAGELET
jgi:ceramide glucosyltransferase